MKQFQKFRKANIAAVTSGEYITSLLMYQCHSAFHSDQNRSRNSSAHGLTRPTYFALGSLENMCKPMSPGTAGGHDPLPIGCTDGRTGIF